VNSRIIVVREDDRLMRHLGGFPTPMLMDLCDDGKAHEAWPYNPEGWKDGPQWRARDDAFDVIHKPADQPYVMVLVGEDPHRDRDE